MTEEQNKLADRLQAMLNQVGHPDYSLRELYEGLKLIVWELRQEREPDPVLGECEECGHTIVTPLKRFREREPATEAVLSVNDPNVPTTTGIQIIEALSRDEILEEAACMAESGQTETVELVPGNFRIERSRPATGKEIAAAIRALKGKGASQGVLWGTGWIYGNNLKRRAKVADSKGEPDDEPWYVTEDGTSWSAFDVTYLPDRAASLDEQKG